MAMRFGAVFGAWNVDGREARQQTRFVTGDGGFESLLAVPGEHSLRTHETPLALPTGAAALRAPGAAIGEDDVVRKFEDGIGRCPVLVPDQGLMGWRVRSFRLGLTYAPGDLQDMLFKFSLLQRVPKDFFADSIERFLAYFTRAQFETALDEVIGLAKPTMMTHYSHADRALARHPDVT